MLEKVNQEAMEKETKFKKPIIVYPNRIYGI